MLKFSQISNSPKTALHLKSSFQNLVLLLAEAHRIFRISISREILSKIRETTILLSKIQLLAINSQLKEIRSLIKLVLTDSNILNFLSKAEKSLEF